MRSSSPASMRRHPARRSVPLRSSSSFILGAAYLAGAADCGTVSATECGAVDRRLAGGERLTTSGTASLPAVSPDGNYVVYVEKADGGRAASASGRWPPAAT